LGHSRPGPAGRRSSHVRYAPKPTVGHQNAIGRDGPKADIRLGYSITSSAAANSDCGQAAEFYTRFERRSRGLNIIYFEVSRINVGRDGRLAVVKAWPRPFPGAKLQCFGMALATFAPRHRKQGDCQ
jgi:hypothetical protein